jgi:hypothetical protein
MLTITEAINQAADNEVRIIACLLEFMLATSLCVIVHPDGVPDRKIRYLSAAVELVRVYAHTDWRNA